MSLPLTKSLLIQLAETRLAEAVHLLDAGHFSGAYYLGGYAVELGLKACIAATFQPQTIPDRRFVERIYTHDLPKLVELAGLETDRSRRAVADPSFARHWQAVEQWSERARYAMVDRGTASELVAALADRERGVFEWIRAFW